MALMIKNPAANAGDAREMGLICVGQEDPLEEEILVFLPEKFYGQRSLAGYSPWGHKESDTTEHTRWYLYSHSWCSLFPKRGCRREFSSSSLPSQLALGTNHSLFLIGWFFSQSL